MSSIISKQKQLLNAVMKITFDKKEAGNPDAKDTLERAAIQVKEYLKNTHHRYNNEFAVGIPETEDACAGMDSNYCRNKSTQTPIYNNRDNDINSKEAV